MVPIRLPVAISPSSVDDAVHNRPSPQSGCKFLCRSSPGQAIVETAVALPLMVLMFAIFVTAGQLIGFTLGLTNAAGTAAVAAAHAANKTGGDPTQAAVTAVNQEQGATNWTACPTSGSPTMPCVSVTAATQSTGSGTSIKVQQVVLHASFVPIFNILGVSLPLSVSAGASQ